MPRRNKTLLELAGTGDDGQTGLLGGGRTPKDDPRIETCGAVDEASSAIGLARALARSAAAAEILEECQGALYRLGAELASVRPGEFGGIGDDDLAGLDRRLAEVEAAITMPSHFILPGASPGSGAIDLARAVVRRAERRLVSLERSSDQEHARARRYLNRLSLLLFAVGRLEEAEAGVTAKAARDRA